MVQHDGGHVGAVSMATYQQASSCYFSSLRGVSGAKAQIKEIMFLWDFSPLFPLLLRPSAMAFKS